MAQVPFQTPLFEVLFVGLPEMELPKPKRRSPKMPPMKVAMLLHFYGIVGPFAPEEQRTSQAYTQFIRELLRDGLVKRPTKAQREEHPGWAYQTTAKGDALVNAICSTPLPVARTRWVIP